jgi:hypothetical protein
MDEVPLEAPGLETVAVATIELIAAVDVRTEGDGSVVVVESEEQIANDEVALELIVAGVGSVAMMHVEAKLMIVAVLLTVQIVERKWNGSIELVVEVDEVAAEAKSSTVVVVVEKSVFEMAEASMTVMVVAFE